MDGGRLLRPCRSGSALLRVSRHSRPEVSLPLVLDDDGTVRVVGEAMPSAATAEQVARVVMREAMTQAQAKAKPSPGEPPAAPSVLH